MRSKIITGLGLPYMGSKRKLAPKIIQAILKREPKVKYLWDLFGGGGAISFYALQHYRFKQVFYNELNTGVVKLLKDLQENGFTDKYYKWIDRETFNQNKDKDTWLGGLCKVVWSFGNSQKGYLFGKDIEEDKRLLHEIVVNECEKSLKEFNRKCNTKLTLESNTLFKETINQRRLRVQKYIKNRDGELQQLQQLQRLEIYNKSYNEIDITTPVNETVIYLDPPYQNTAKYEKDISHDELLKWIKRQKCKVYVSSYEFKELECIAEFEHRSTLSATANNKVIEKLFYWDGTK